MKADIDLMNAKCTPLEMWRNFAGTKGCVKARKGKLLMAMVVEQSSIMADRCDTHMLPWLTLLHCSIKGHSQFPVVPRVSVLIRHTSARWSGALIPLPSYYILRGWTVMSMNSHLGPVDVKICGAKGREVNPQTRQKEFTQAAIHSPNRKDDSDCRVSQTNPRIVHYELFPATHRQMILKA
ncbi:hypothetical protein Q8A73_021971 [Channa argus]|nr:hypothetical protein Q8A73_021971 [Channa argus]